jgi:hypothetical protein
MPFPPLYSESNTPLPEVFTYDSIPLGLKNQVIHIWNDFFFNNERFPEKDAHEIWENIEKNIAEAHGLDSLASEFHFVGLSDYGVVCRYFKSCELLKTNLDIVQLSFNWIESIDQHFQTQFGRNPLTHTAGNAINKLNHRFRQNGIGYQYQNRAIIKVDSQLLYQEIIKPALNLLNDPLFNNPNKEYLEAHEYFKKNDFKACVISCGKALESTMKIICTQKRWEYGDGTSSKLFNACFTNHLIPLYLQDHFNGIRKTMEAAATIRNKIAHGGGETGIEIPAHFATYVLNLTGTTIKFLYDCFSAL